MSRVLEDELRAAAEDALEVLREQFQRETGRDPLPDPLPEGAVAGGPEQRNQLLGYCYQNAREMSGQLHDRNIPHHVLYVGLTNMVVQEQYPPVDEEDLANPGAYPENVPRTREELSHSCNHYIVEVRGAETDFETDEDFIVEPVSEVFQSEDAYGEIRVGAFPTEDYLRLEDSEVEPWHNDDPDWHWNARTGEVYPEEKYA